LLGHVLRNHQLSDAVLYVHKCDVLGAEKPIFR